MPGVFVYGRGLSDEFHPRQQKPEGRINFTFSGQAKKIIKMERKDISIVFMGTPEFAVASLSKIVESGFRVSAVVTVPDKPAGRGLKPRMSPVKEYALALGLPVLQPEKLRDQDFLDTLNAFGANLYVVVAFRKLPAEVWSVPELGTFNLHASLLPHYRGAAPINHAIINGENMSGVTTFFIDEGIDTGSMILRREVSIGPDETAGELHDRLMTTGAELVAETIAAIASGTLQTARQPASEQLLRTAPRIFREDCIIQWNKTAQEVHNFVRGLSPYPGAGSTLITGGGERDVKILRTKRIGKRASSDPGKIHTENKQLFAECGDEMLEILDLQPAGKKTMTAAEFLRGMREPLIRFKG
jgi:methionyl-tRNA formyltransferase